MQKHTINEICLASNAAPFPEQLVAELQMSALHIENYRRIYLGYAVLADKGAQEISPILILERIGAVNRSDLNRLNRVMKMYYSLHEYDIRDFPIGPWWRSIADASTIIRDFAS